MADYKASGEGVAIHPWINTADTKYNQQGLYHVDHAMTDEAARLHMEELDAIAADMKLREAAAERRKIKDWKKWKKEVHMPYIVETDDQGVPTGRVVFKYKQNAVIPLPDGSEKKFIMGIRDGKNKVITTPIYGGSIIRVMWAPRIVPLQSSRQFGLRLDFCMVQLIKPAQSKGGKGFDEVEGAYVDEGFDDSGRPEADNDADY